MKLSGFDVRSLAPSDHAIIADLFASDPNHSALVQSGVLAPDKAHAIFTDLPLGKALHDKFVWGVFDDGAVVAVIDLIRDYPTPDTWVLGLLFVTPQLRNEGLGARMIDAVCRHAAEEGGAKLRLAVTHKNTDAQRFYVRAGFSNAGTRDRREADGRVTKLHVMDKALTRA